MTVKTVTFYRVDTGEITGTAAFHDPYLVTVPDGEACLQGRIDGERFYIVGGAPVAYPPRPHPHAEFDHSTHAWVDGRLLEQIKSEARAKLTSWVEAQRRQYVTDLPGQDMIYLAKEAEAHRFLSDPDPDLAGYPFISREVGITAPTAYQIAQIWAWMAEFWRAAAAELEQVRLGLAAQIDLASTKEEVETIARRGWRQQRAARDDASPSELNQGYLMQ